MSLLTSLVAHWKLGEASGTRSDSHGANHLTDINTVLSATGKLGDAADFELSNSEKLTLADNTDVSAGDVDFTWAGWVKIEALPGSNAKMDILCKGTTADFEYLLRLDNTGGVVRFMFFVFTSAQVSVSVTASNFGTPSTATWYFLVAWHDATANTINIQVNDGTLNSIAHSAGVDDGAGPLVIGGQDASSARYFDGLVDSLSLWKRVLTTQEKTDLYNSGNGLDYESFSGDTLGEMVGSFTMTLTPTGTLTGFGEMVGSTTFALSFAGALTATGSLSGAFTMELSFAGDTIGLGQISGTFPIELNFGGALSSNALEGTFTMALSFTGALDGSGVIPTPDVDEESSNPCNRCDGEIENQGSAIVSAGYRLAIAGAFEAADRRAPAIASSSYRLPRGSVSDCKTIRKN